MKMELYNLEVGVLLKEDNEEFDCYNGVYDTINAYYDENEIVYSKEEYDKAIEYAKKYVKDGVNRTYAILTSQGLFEIEDEEELNNIKESGLVLDYSCKNICYSILKNDKGEIIEHFVENK